MATHQMPMTNTAMASHWAKSVGCGKAAARPAAPRPMQPLARSTTLQARSHSRIVTLRIVT